MLVPFLKQLSPQMAPMLEAAEGHQGKPSASFAYADQDAVRVLSNSGGGELAGVLIGAAVAIPNLMKSRAAANEAGAAATIRTLIVDQITYSNTYPEHGYSRDLVSLGGGAHCTPTKAHACLIDDVLGCASGTSSTPEPGGRCLPCRSTLLPRTRTTTVRASRSDRCSACSSPLGFS